MTDDIKCWLKQRITGHLKNIISQDSIFDFERGCQEGTIIAYQNVIKYIELLEEDSKL